MPEGIVSLVVKAALVGKIADRAPDSFMTLLDNFFFQGYFFWLMRKKTIFTVVLRIRQFSQNIGIWKISRFPRPFIDPECRSLTALLIHSSLISTPKPEELPTERIGFLYRNFSN